jgi:hypothetical protein
LRPSASRFSKFLGQSVLAALAAVGLVAGAAEVAARVSGAVDFPIFSVSARAGYYPAPNQHGRFLNSNTWVFNDHSLGNMQPYSPAPNDVLIVGDSVVYGGNPIDHADKLAILLENFSGRRVWSLAAGGWALENQLQMLKRDPGLLNIKTIIFVKNSGDFGDMNVWKDAITYPLDNPSCAICYLFDKYIFRSADVVDSPRSPAATLRWQASLREFLASYKGTLIWVLYPKAAEIGHLAPEFNDIMPLIENRAKIIQIGAVSNWSRTYYRDSIHPNLHGNAEIARAIVNGADLKLSPVR